MKSGQRSGQEFRLGTDLPGLAEDGNSAQRTAPGDDPVRAFCLRRLCLHFPNVRAGGSHTRVPGPVSSSMAVVHVALRGRSGL